MSSQIVVFYEEGSISKFVELPKNTSPLETRSIVRDKLSKPVSKGFHIAEGKVAEERVSAVTLFTENGFILSDDIASIGDSGCERIYAIVSAPLKSDHVDPHSSTPSTPLLDRHQDAIEDARKDAVEASESTINEMKRQIRVMEEEAEMLRKSLERQKRRNEDAKKSRKVLREENQALTVRIETLEKRHDKLKRSDTKLQEENDQFREDIERLRTELDDILASLDEQAAYALAGPSTSAEAVEHIGLRKLIDVSQAYLAKAAKLEPTSLAWRKYLHQMNDEERIEHVKTLSYKSKDKKVQNVLASDHALRLVTQRRSEARDQGNQAAHKAPKRAVLEPFVEKKLKAGEDGYKVLSDNFAE